MPEVAGLDLPDWAAVQARRFEPWVGPVLRLDTARTAAEDLAGRIGMALGDPSTEPGSWPETEGTNR